MSVQLQRNIGQYIAGAFGMASTAIASDTTSDNDPKYGASIDRLALGRRYLSAKILAPVRVEMVNGKKATITVGMQDSADNTNWTNYPGYAAGEGSSGNPGQPTALVVGTSATSVSDTGGDRVAYVDVDLTRARRYIRPSLNVAYTVTSSNAAATGMLVWAFAGAEVVPAT